MPKWRKSDSGVCISPRRRTKGDLQCFPDGAHRCFAEGADHNASGMALLWSVVHLRPTRRPNRPNL